MKKKKTFVDFINGRIWDAHVFQSWKENFVSLSLFLSLVLILHAARSAKNSGLSLEY